jgi:hypothetical protein
MPHNADRIPDEAEAEELIISGAYRSTPCSFTTTPSICIGATDLTVLMVPRRFLVEDGKARRAPVRGRKPK